MTDAEEQNEEVARVASIRRRFGQSDARAGRPASVYFSRYDAYVEGYEEGEAERTGGYEAPSPEEREELGRLGSSNA